MFCKRLVKLTVCMVLLQLVGYLLYQYSSYWSMLSQFSDSVKTVNVIRDVSEIFKDDLGNTHSSHNNRDNNMESLQFSGTIPGALKNAMTVDVSNKAKTASDKVVTVASNNAIGNNAESATIDVANDKMTDKTLVQEVTALLKVQLQLNNTATPFDVKRPCVPKPTWNYACVHQNCTQLSNNITERVQSLISEKTMLTKEQDDLLRSISLQIPENDVILASAASSNHYDEMQAMLHSLHSMVFPELSRTENFSLVLWDIGLTSDQRRKTEKCCRCQVISFPFEKFPKRVMDLRCYMWKPLVIRMTQLRARKYAVWQDASIRYIRFPGPVFEKGGQHGLQLMRQKAGVSTPHRTLPETFAYLGQKACSFFQYPETAATFGVYKHDQFVLTAVTNPWARCGFEEACMCPKPSMPSYRCVYGPCHRFDQSALTIITATLYSSEIYRILQFEEDLRHILWVGRNDKEMNYFNSTGCFS